MEPEVLMQVFEDSSTSDFIKRTSVYLKKHISFFGEAPRDVVNHRKKLTFIHKYIDDVVISNFQNNQAVINNQFYNGYFKGLKFGNLINLQAGIAQKLLGVYEVELVPELKSLESQKYDWVINIGAAEGLYSLAFAKKWNVPVFSFEQDFSTRELLRKMVTLNNSPEARPLGEFNENHLKQLDLDRGLIFCDCEGYETTLFSEQYAHFVKKHDLVIETHDCFVNQAHEKVKRSLVSSHNLKDIDQVSLEDRCKLVEDDFFSQLPMTTQVSLLNEDRNPEIRWLIALSKQSRI